MGKKEDAVRLVVGSAVKEVLSGYTNEGTALRVAGDLDEALNAKVASILEEAANRCVANGRSTVRPADL